MKLPVIKSALEIIESDGVEAIETSINVLDHLGQARGIKEHEEEVIGELISNLFGAIEVKKSIDSGVPQKEALNSFMKRVLVSIDK